MSQVQITKAAGKAATKATAAKKAPAKRTTRTAPKAKATAQSIAFLPSQAIAMSGHYLASFTRAWMEITGFLDGKPVETKMIQRLLGSGVRYHETRGRITKSAQGYIITDEGKAFFLTRDTIVPNPEFVEAYKALMTKGTPAVSIRVKDAKQIVKVAA